MAFEIFQAQEQAAIHRQAQAVHHAHVGIADRRVPLLQPLERGTGKALANLLGRPTTYCCGRQFTLRRTFTALSRQLQGQSLGQEAILLRPAFFGQVVDDALQQRVIEGYLHGAHSIHTPENPTAPLSV